MGMFHIISNLLVIFDSNQTQICGLNTRHTRILSTEYQIERSNRGLINWVDLIQWSHILQKVIKPLRSVKKSRDFNLEGSVNFARISPP